MPISPDASDAEMLYAQLEDIEEAIKDGFDLVAWAVLAAEYGSDAASEMLRVNRS